LLFYGTEKFSMLIWK